MDFRAWLKLVAQYLNERDVESSNVSAGKWTPANIQIERSDEPRDMFDDGMTEREYADFLEEEYDMFGPDGE